MALIKCPECGKEISDRAASCPNCGCPVEKTQTDNPPLANRKIQEDYTKMAAQAEKKAVESRVTGGNRVAAMIAIVLGIFSLLGGIMGSFDFLLILGGLFFLILGISVLGSLNRDKKRIQYLQNISDGKKEILICPYCKGSKIIFDTVQSGVHTSGQTASISDNINPLHPFTHTNVKTTGTHSNISYKTLYICQDCGKAFDNPDKVWS